MMWHMWEIPSGMGWWMGLGWLWILVLWGGIIALVVWIVKKLTEKGQTTSKRDPLDVAKERYAKGEITRDEFEQIKKDLS